MKKIISVVLTVVLVFGCFSFVGAVNPLSGVIIANAKNFDTESGVNVEIAPFLYKSTLYTIEYPTRESYAVKAQSIEGDYTISRELNELEYTFVFPAGTTEITCVLSVNGQTDWSGFEINSTDNPNYWEKDEDGNADLTQPVTFRRDEYLAESDEYGLVYRDSLKDKNIKGYMNYDKIYWKLMYTCNGEKFEDRFDIDIYDYDKAEKSTLRAANFNIAGLPFSALLGENVAENQKVAAEYLSNGNFDVVAVQEDFGYHEEFVSNMNGFAYATNHTGSVPGGDGLNIFTKNTPLYNETRVAWNDSFGILSEGSDELTPKGFVYTVLDVGNGIYVDFYNLHADAFSGDGSVAARSSQFRQLAEFINARSAENDRPVIITGDFNNHMHVHEDDGALYNTLVTDGGFKDAWIEYHNDGDYFNLYKWHISGLPAWGNWDSVERFMYKPGGGVDILINDFRYTRVCNSQGETVSDHNSAECDFTFVKTPDFKENTQELEVIPATENVLHRFIWILKALILILSDLVHIPELITDFIG